MRGRVGLGLTVLLEVRRSPAPLAPRCDKEIEGVSLLLGSEQRIEPLTDSKGRLCFSWGSGVRCGDPGWRPSSLWSQKLLTTELGSPSQIFFFFGLVVLQPSLLLSQGVGPSLVFHAEVICKRFRRHRC